MKKRRLFLCLLFMLAVMLLPATIQAASAPGTVKLSSISAPAYNKINVKWKRHQEPLITSFIIRKKERKSGQKSKRLTTPRAAIRILLQRSIQSL